MATLSVGELLEVISEESPSGDNLEYEPEFGEIERASKGKAEQTLGDATTDAEPPDWRYVEENTVTLLQKTKDLRLAVMRAQSLLNLEGLSGFASGLQLIQGLVDDFWDSVHPELDAEDDDDPTLRVNTLTVLADSDGILKDLSEAVLMSTRGFGSVCLRDVLIARGDIEVHLEEGVQVVDMASVTGTFMECELEELKTQSEALTMCMESAASIEKVVNLKVGSSELDLKALAEIFAQARDVFDEFLIKRGEVVESAEGDGAAAGSDGIVAGAISNREDALRMLDKIIAYYKSSEPSSPIPLLLQRAKRLANLDFLEIVKDIASDGLGQVRSVGGIDFEDRDN
mgnify:CR=1 FL=1